MVWTADRRELRGLSMVLVATVLGSSLGATAAGPPADPPPDPAHEPHETRSNDPWIRPAAPARSARAVVWFGGYSNAQVNLDGAGLNIVGDAANEPSLAVDPSARNLMVAGWRQFDTITSNFRQAGYAVSRDGGRTWSPQRVIEPGVFRSDPVLLATGDGVFHYNSLTITSGDYTCDVFVSTDGGETWPTKRFAFGGDKQWFVADATGGSGHGNIYQVWNFFYTPFAPAQFNRSPGGQLFWEPPVTFSGGARPIFGTLDVGPDGAVYVTGAQGSSSSQFWVLKSTDAQSQAIPSFPQQAQINMGGNSGYHDAPNPGGLLSQVEIRTDHSGGPHHGNVYVTGAIIADGGTSDIHLVRSTDGGVTWSNPLRINDDDTDAWQWIATMDVAPNGRIDVVWNDGRHFPDDAQLSELYYAYSTDGGVTFSPNIQLSSEWDSHIGWPNQNKIGDYYDVVSDDVGAHVLWAATFNGEQDVYCLRIGDYDCNGNGIGDSDDLADGTSLDCNGNDIPDECEIAAGVMVDLDGDGVPDACGDCNDNGVPDWVDVAEGTSDDCNGNGLPDACDVASEASPDCNANGTPDECEIDGGISLDCNGNGVPDACDVAGGASADCNENGVPDACEVAGNFEAASEQLGPIGRLIEQTFVITDAHPASSDVVFELTAIGDFALPWEVLRVELNGEIVGLVFTTDGLLCEAMSDELVLSPEIWNAALGDGNVMNVVLSTPSSVDAFVCPSWVAIHVEHQFDGPNDVNRNGVPDDCEPACPDLDDSGAVDFADLLTVLGMWGACPAGCPADLDGDGVVGEIDLAILLVAWGPCP